MPTTYCINDQNWPHVLKQMAHEHYEGNNKALDHLSWILKPALLNNGQHIKIFQKLNEIEEHYLSAKRLGGEHVLQEYLRQPHLLKGPTQGHKYSIRVFVIATNYTGAYLYPQGYFNVALHPYQSCDFTDLRPHLTNEHLRDDELNVVQVPTQQYEIFKSLYPQIKNNLSTLIAALKERHPHAFICDSQRNLSIFGFDFIVDNTMQPWLLEANHAPCFPIDVEHPLQKSLYSHFWQAVISNFVLPIAREQPTDSIHYEIFEAL